MKKNIITVGFAVFTMFFGAGNIVLPLQLMQKTNNWFSAFAGFCITAVIFTLLGLIGSVLVKGDLKKFFAPLGFYNSNILQGILILIEGPFGIVPRSLIVAHGSFATLFPSISKEIFYGFSCILLYFLVIQKNRLVQLIGNLFTPIMLIILLSIVVNTYLEHGTSNIHFSAFNLATFVQGLNEGYLTYDLPGALYFTAIAVIFLKKISKTEQEIVTNGVKASFVSAFLLIIIYFLFVYMGLAYQHLLQDVAPEMILPIIIKQALGKTFAYFFVLLIYIACITTALAALTVWTEYISEYFVKFGYQKILIVSLVITFFMSLLSFNKLMNLLGPVLNIVYPILVLLTIYNIVKHYHQLKRS